MMQWQATAAGVGRPAGCDLAQYEFLVELPQGGTVPLALTDSLLGVAYRLWDREAPWFGTPTHDQAGAKPFAVTPLRTIERFVRPQEELAPGWYSWRVSGLGAAAVAAWEAVASAAAEGPLAWTLGGLTGRLVAGRRLLGWSSAELAASWLETPTDPAALPARCTWIFETPTFFRGRDPAGHNLTQLWPQPDLVLRSLARRWNQLGCRPLDLAAVAPSEALPHLVEWSGETLLVRLQDRWQRAFCGEFTWELPADPALRRLVGLLASFAPLAGVGARTTHGLGVVVTTLHAPPRRRGDRA
ncbi:MAG: CRISPR system precrRNA processing endoribonuclease RAMP protein Cas6 [Fimbriimonadaceae bacterium]|nr:CRISPR system precrRNA processing endoribonuclease RAMP protein Cas6 [Fimbriimonadaceae bacterium]